MNSLMDLVKRKARSVNDDDEELYTFEEVFPAVHPGMAVSGFRFRDGLTQEDLAEHLGIPQARVLEFESGIFYCHGFHF